MFSRVWSSAGIWTSEGIADFFDDLLEDEQGLSMGGLLTVVNGSFYPLSYINIGMHLTPEPVKWHN